MKIGRLTGSERIRIGESLKLVGRGATISGQRRPAVTIARDGIEIDLNKVSIRSGISKKHLRSGIGIYLEGRRNVVIRRARVTGYKCNLYLKNCKNVVIEDCDLSGSRASILRSRTKYDPQDWVDIFKPRVWRTYGAGIVLENCRRCRVETVRANGAQNGLWLVDSKDCVVVNCDFSHNSGWGIWMWGSHGNRILHNNCDWCVRCEDPQRFSAGGDSAGIMLSNDSCHNLIAHNSFTHSGDGFFLNGWAVEPSSDNVIAFNDGSHSPHNAFESSYGPRNRFIGNIANNSRHGFWLGFSYDNEILGNIVENIVEWGIAIEHGYGNVIAGNEIRRAEVGVCLFTRKRGEQRSRGYEIAQNAIEQCDTALLFSETSDCRVTGNRIDGRRALVFRNRSRGHVLRHNNISAKDALVEIENARDIDLQDNFWGETSRKRVMERVRLLETKTSEPALTRAAKKPWPIREPAVVAQLADPVRRAEREFRWYSEKKHLVGVADML
jgi:parallel beta-helix repeat protein